MRDIRVGIIGVGNCASSLVQGVEFYAQVEADYERREQVTPDDPTSFTSDFHPGLAHPSLAGFTPRNIRFVAAWDVDQRKVGYRLSEAVYNGENNTFEILEELHLQPDPIVAAAPVLDGLGKKLRERILVADAPLDPSDVEAVDEGALVASLRDSGVEVLVNYLPVGSETATRLWASVALAAGVSFVNAIPVFIASSREWGNRFTEASVPIVGDDIKSQVGATIVHRRLLETFASRGYRVSSTYQLNFGGNMDFYNMLGSERLDSKRKSKTGSALAALPYELDAIHVSPSDYVPFLEDRKIAMIRIEGDGWGGAPMNLELRMEVWDSPNSAGVVVDAIRACAIARDAGVGGPLIQPSAFLMKTPPQQREESLAHAEFQSWVQVLEYQARHAPAPAVAASGEES